MLSCNYDSTEHDGFVTLEIKKGTSFTMNKRLTYLVSRNVSNVWIHSAGEVEKIESDAGTSTEHITAKVFTKHT